MRYGFERFVLDTSAGTLTGPSGPVRLRPQTQRLLEVLVEAAPALVEHNQLLDSVWGVEHLSPGSLPQAVSELRQALGDDARSPRFIDTVPRRGYRFVARVVPATPDDDATLAAPPVAVRASRRRAGLVASLVIGLASATGLMLLAPWSRTLPPRADVVVRQPWTELDDPDLASAADRLSGRLAAGLVEGSGRTVRVGTTPGVVTVTGRLVRQPEGVDLQLTLSGAAGETRQAWQAHGHSWKDLERRLDTLLPEIRERVDLEVLRVAVAEEDPWLGYCADAATSPDDLRAFTEAWDLYLELRHREAAAISGSVAAARPRFWPAAIPLALASRDRGEVAEAGMAVARALHHLPPGETPARLALEQVEATLDGRWELAARRLERLSVFVPGSDILTFELARALSYAGRADEARPLILGLLERDWRSEWPTLPILASHLLLASGDVDLAFTVAREASSRFPDHATVMATFALAAGLAGRVAEAEEAADRSARIAAVSPEGLEQLLDLGPAKLRAVVAHLPSRACERLARCSAAQQLAADRLLPWALVVDGCGFRDEGLQVRLTEEVDLGARIAAAWLACPGSGCVEEVLRADALDPELAVARHELAVLWLQAGDHERGQEWLRRCRLGPGHDPVWEWVDPAFVPLRNPAANRQIAPTSGQMVGTATRAATAFKPGAPP